MGEIVTNTEVSLNSIPKVFKNYISVGEWEKVLQQSLQKYTSV